MKQSLLSLWFGGICALACHSPPPSTPEGQHAEQTIAAAKTFSAARVGYSARMPDQVHAWRTLLNKDNSVAVQREEADRIFKTLVQHASPVAQLYGLSGVYVTDSAYFEKVLPQFLSRTDSVETLIGCIRMPYPVSAVAQEIGAGIWSHEFSLGNLTEHPVLDSVRWSESMIRHQKQSLKRE